MVLMHFKHQGTGKTSGDIALHVACFYGEADIVKVEGGAYMNREKEVCLYILLLLDHGAYPVEASFLILFLCHIT